jgi:hypothetical protein
MMHTYGIGFLSVPQGAFPLSEGQSASEEKQFYRKFFITALLIHNSVLQILAFFPLISTASGCFRVAAGVGMFIGGTILYSRKVESKFAEELWAASVGQIFRGVLEALHIGMAVNLFLDVLVTISVIAVAAKNGDNAQLPVPAMPLPGAPVEQV